MSAITGVEIGPNYYVLVRTGRRGSRTTVAAARAVTPGEWSGNLEVLADVLRQARLTNQLSERANVVTWGAQPANYMRHAPEIAPLVSAGFEIGAVLTPSQALAKIVQPRRVEGSKVAVAALSLNTHGALIAIVLGEAILVSRSFEWPLGRPFSGKRSEQLERYLIISQLAPQLKHLIELVRPVFGVSVTSAVACGNLPDLRSLMMLLIDEMDIEVETLDSAEMLEPRASFGRYGDSAARLQLASAAATFGERSVPERPVGDRLEDLSRIHVQTRRGTQAIARIAAVAAAVLTAVWSGLAVSGSSPATPLFPMGIETAAAVVPAVPDLRAEATMGRIARVDEVADRVAESPPSDVRVAPRAAGPDTAVSTPSTPAPPLPQVDGVVIAGERRLAIVAGIIVAPGDRVGQRLVARIVRDGVVLREPSGEEIHVAIRTRKAGS